MAARLPLRFKLADAPLLGALLLALGNAADIAVTLRMPPGGAAVRAAHHAFDVLDTLDEEMRMADEVAVGNLSEAEQRQLLKLLEGVRAGQRAASEVVALT